MTHKQILLKHFKKGRPITRIQAAQLYFIHELSNRIGELEKDGHKIERKWITITKSKKRVMKYWMDKEIKNGH